MNPQFLLKMATIARRLQQKNFYLMYHCCGHRPCTVWHIALDQLTKLANGELTPWRHWSLRLYISRSLPNVLFAFWQSHRPRDMNFG